MYYSFEYVYSSSQKSLNFLPLLQVDNAAFHVAKGSDNIRARKDHRIVVGFDGSELGAKATVMGKLTVTCAKSAGGACNVQWVYYLKGTSG